MAIAAYFTAIYVCCEVAAVSAIGSLTAASLTSCPISMAFIGAGSAVFQTQPGSTQPVREVVPNR